MTIAGVVALAALIGWLVTGLVGRSRVEPTKRAAAPDVEDAGAEIADQDPKEMDADQIERKLAALAWALRLDETIEATVFPSAVSEPALGGAIDYRHPARFWQPAFASAAKK